MFTRYRNRGNKAKDQEAHAIRRAYLRYGLRLTQNDLAEIRHMIQAGQSTCVELQSNRIAVHELHYRGARIRVVYDKQRKTVVTFLNEDMDDFIAGKGAWA